jgi:hypothetical protein
MTWSQLLGTFDTSREGLFYLFGIVDAFYNSGGSPLVDKELDLVDLSTIHDEAMILGVYTVASWGGPRPFLTELRGKVEARLLEVTKDPEHVKDLLRGYV